MSTTAPWQSITLTNGNIEVRGTSARGIALLHEYRATESIAGWWPCTVAELEHHSDANGGECADAGVPVDAIDWTGFPTADEVARIMRNVPGRDRHNELSAAEIADAIAD